MLELFTTDWKEIWGETDREFSLGSIYTRPEIVELILDLSGYDALNHRLISYRTLEPSCGNGAFVTAIVHRLILSELHWSKTIDWYDPLWDQTLLASDIDLETIAQLRRTITALLIEAGCPTNRSHELSQQWTVQTDFLLHDWQGCFHFILGNPPYVRIEDLPKPVLHRYREQYRTATDRADIYVPFIERSLQLLAPNGTLGIICTNRFTKNKYGKRLRELISASHHVKWYINLEHTQPFEQNVSAYPAIFVLDNAKGEETQATTLTDLSPETLQAVRLKGSDSQELISTFPSWYRNGTPWISTSHKRLTLLQKLEEHFPTLAETPSEITIGIGVATGADKVFILPKKREDIESEHQLPLLMSSHVGESELCWEGEYLINPFADEKTTELVDLEKSAGLRNYLYQHEQRLRQRYIAQASPENWYRTIDRVWPSLVKEPKLVIPDIQS
ncbi:MAG: Eco57I restriction-modification methylase domain-containing protein, partial [Candidatus Kapaibacterium sp.]